MMHEAIIQAWDCALAGTRVTYLSGPITTGRRYIDTVRNKGRSAKTKNAVLHENLAALVATAKRLRSERREVVVEPASLNLPEWSQGDYHRLWEGLIERHARLLIFMPDWEYSVGCAIEFAHASKLDIPTQTLSGSPITVDDGMALLTAARDDILADDANGTLASIAERLGEVVERLEILCKPAKTVSQELRKDQSLDLLAERGFNVAQFVSFFPKNGKPRQAYARIAGREPNEVFRTPREAIAALLASSSDGAVNVRSYQPHDPQSREFVYGLTTVDAALATVERLSGEGLHTIVNETIDVGDGGVSGVLMGDVLEFSPDDTPRCVEKPGTASLPRGLGRELLATVYGFPIELPVPFASRLEFSLHPKPRGWKSTNITTWEFGPVEPTNAHAQTVWPNNFSRMIGDKTFGLLMAHHVGLPVPRTTVINRRVAPFTFGRTTGWNERWIRTAPPEQMPGLFSTRRGWVDPFALLQAEDPENKHVASILCQDGVRPAFSGALIVTSTGEPVIEGVAGTGDSLMVGESTPETLPAAIADDIKAMYRRAKDVFGPVRFEWVHDGDQVWIVQLHRGATESDATRLTSGDARDWVEFDVTSGLPALRSLLSDLPGDTGLLLKGRVGLTSHIADVVRRARIPARMTH